MTADCLLPTIFAAVQLSIIIVNYNVRYFLEQCLCSVRAAVSQLPAEVIVVDNNSTDGSLTYLQQLFPWVKWIANTTNTGFGAANNQAVAVAKGEYILFLNPDTLLPENCLQQCLRFMQTRPQAGALGIKMLDGSGLFLPESKRGFPSLLTSFFKLSGLTSRFPHSKTFARYYLGNLNNNENHLVDVLAGAFMLVRGKILQQTGAFDERFFMYGEDIDLSYRVQQAGWQNWYFAGSSIIHFKGESTKKGSLNYVRMFYQAMHLFVQKHYGGRNAKIYRWLIEAAIGARAGITVLASGFRKWRGLYVGKGQKTGLPAGDILVIATQQTAKDIKSLLAAGNITAHQIAFAIISTENGKDFFQKTKGISTVHDVIIFGIDRYLPLETVIDQMPHLSAKQFGFHFKDSRSIISSSSKNGSGSWIAG